MTPSRSASSGTPLLVTGTYDASDAFGRFAAAPSDAVGARTVDTPPDLLVGPSVFAALGLNDADAARQLVANIRVDEVAVVCAADTLVEIIALEAVGAAWLGAALVFHRVSRERSAEITLARTRGFWLRRC